jgi:BMFP domain-containing protein YqiC
MAHPPSHRSQTEGKEHLKRIIIKQYEQAADEKVSIGGIKWINKWDVCVQCDSREEAEALKAKLAEPEKEQEPVSIKPIPNACAVCWGSGFDITGKPCPFNHGPVKFYTAPPAQENKFNPDWDAMAVMVEEQQRMAKRIEELEAKLKEKNFDDYKVVNADIDSYSGVTYSTQDGIAVFSSGVVKWLLENKAGLYWEENRGN